MSATNPLEQALTANNPPEKEEEAASHLPDQCPPSCTEMCKVRISISLVRKGTPILPTWYNLKPHSLTDALGNLSLRKDLTSCYQLVLSGHRS
ncbi:hypothetical protein COLO4_01920 [Corchorus olitorius]|uniref:Uncharacterized protein n=1 Tax=Corchorus olitorius TaxID=93759 RepID=A0A1R3L1X5_9ROSI|nr:hypothetical protein COLO4_01920 [Corchorus olitorius]